MDLTFQELLLVLTMRDKGEGYLSYGQHRIQDCELTRDRVTNWLYLFLDPLASFNLLQYYIRLGSETVA